MKTLEAIAALSAVLLIAGCSDAPHKEATPQTKPLGLMAAPEPTANAIEAVPVEENATNAADAEPVQQGNARRPLGSHTIGDRRQ